LVVLHIPEQQLSSGHRPHFKNALDYLQLIATTTRVYVRHAEQHGDALLQLRRAVPR